MLRKQSANIRGNKILVTGGAGFIGSYVAEQLVEENQVTIFDNFRRNALQFTQLVNHPNLKLYTEDVLDRKALSKAMIRQEYVIHLAAIAGVSSYEKDPLATLEVDAWGIYNVLQLAAENGVRQVIISSSSEVYGPQAHNVNEASLTCQGPATESRWSYGVGKLVGDHFAFAFSKMKGLNITILRPFNIYGPRQVGEGAIQIFCQQALKDTPITVSGKGDQIRSWCYIEDFVNVMITCIANPKTFSQIFNIGNPQEPITIVNLATLIKEISKSSSPITFVPARKSEVLTRSPNTQKAIRLLQFHPAVNLRTGLTRTLDWYRKVL